MRPERGIPLAAQDELSLCAAEARGVAELLLALLESPNEPRDSLGTLHGSVARLAERLEALVGEEAGR